MNRFAKVKQVRTRRGLRLVQHGVILSEILTRPGPTNTVADVLAALIALLGASPPVALLGFAGGSLLAPLRALGDDHTIRAVDLDPRGFDIFQQLCFSWAGAVEFEVAEAGSWLRAQKAGFSVVIDDLSIGVNNDVVKPELSWTELPLMIQERLVPDGVALFNLLSPVNFAWQEGLSRVIAPFPQALMIQFAEFENRVVIAGQRLPKPHWLGRRLRELLLRLKSPQARRIAVRSLIPDRALLARAE